MNISGVSTLIGKKTGGVVHHAIMCQQCRICDCAAKRGIRPKNTIEAPDCHIVRNMH
jgi:hypothetical protein